MKCRVDIVGPKVREIFAKFVENVESMIENVSKLYIELVNLSITNLPSDANDYVGAFVAPGEFIPSLITWSVQLESPQAMCGSVPLLSDFIAKQVALFCIVEDKRKLED